MVCSEILLFIFIENRKSFHQTAPIKIEQRFGHPDAERFAGIWKPEIFLELSREAFNKNSVYVYRFIGRVFVLHSDN